MTSVIIKRPALHKLIHRYSRLSKALIQEEEQEWESCDETDDEDNYSVYSDEYLTQEEYSGDEAEEDYDMESIKRYTISVCATDRASKRQKL